ncbi:MAG: ribonuclease III [Terracidiphilus sp.]|nr:ribonuclease III [Terracidiphilus sp.]
METALAELEAALGHGFGRRELLVRALTHRSLANERGANERAAIDAAAAHEGDTAEVPGDNERLEFLGDAVLGLVVAEALFIAHPEWHEGELTRVRAQLVSRKHMAEVAMEIGLGGHLRLSRGEDRSGLRSKATVLSNTMEAVMGALFLDGGLEAVRDFVRRSVMGEAAEHLAEELRSGAALGNFKSALQEHSQREGAGTPVYKVKSESGPDHRKRFLVEVRLKAEDGTTGPPLAAGKGSTKKLAEQDAARRALERTSSAETGQGAGEEKEEKAAG